MCMQWSRSNTEHLIVLLQQKRCLWDIKHESYSDREKKEHAYNCILKELVELLPGLTLKDVKNKIHVVRSQFRKELRALENSKRSGSGAAEVVKPKLWCFDLLDFLRPVSKIRNSISNIGKERPLDLEEELDVQEEDEEWDKENTPSSSTRTPKRTKKRMQEEYNTGLIKLADALNKQQKRRYEWLGERLVEVLNTFSDEEYADSTAEEVQKVLGNAISRRRMRKKQEHNRDILSEALEGILDSDSCF